jgi:uncharacterized damage-inducible protein DinB
VSGDLEALLEELATARAALLTAAEGVTPDALLRPDGNGLSVREVLWRTGLLDDWYRLLIDQALGGRPLAPWKDAPRPHYIESLELLRAWLEQTRGALLARAHHLSPADLDTEFTLPEGEVRTPRQLLAHLVEQDLEHAAQVVALLA